LRWRVPWLLPRYSNVTGLPLGILEARLAHTPPASQDVVFIGDSFVEMGMIGWLPMLSHATGRSCTALGFGGACPSQYFAVLDRIRADGYRGLAVLVLYAGNDISDEGIWAGVSEPRGYPYARTRHYGDVASESFYPCYDRTPTWPAPFRDGLALLEEHSALYRGGSVASNLLKARFTRPPTSEADVVAFLTDRCMKPTHVEVIGGRPYFLRHHEAGIESDANNRLGRARILKGLAARRADRSLAVVVVLDREETCAALHGRPLTPARPIIEEIRRIGIDVIDPSASFDLACGSRELYLPDGHWNAAGHRLFAQAIESAITTRLCPRPVL
jgi:hypothetical protein